MEYFRTHLQDFLKKQQHKNAAFSMRALARMLEVDPSYLVHIKQGKKNPSVNLMKKFSSLSQIPIRSFTEWSGKIDKDVEREETDHYHEEQLYTLSHYLTIPLLNVMANFPRMSAEDLCLLFTEERKVVLDHIDDLEDKKLISKDVTEGWIVHHQYFSFLSKKENITLRKLNREFLNYALWGLDSKNIALDDRDYNSYTFFCKKDDFEKMRKEMLQTIIGLAKSYEEGIDATDPMYRMTWQLLPIKRHSQFLKDSLEGIKL
jgi:transcriptional regulator with XRE-family HTH domain